MRRRAADRGWKQRRQWQLGPQGGELLRLGVAVPVLLLLAAMVGLTVCAGHLLGAVERGGAAWLDDGMLAVVGGGFLLVSLAVVVVQAMRVAHRVAGPEYRLIQTLRRIRTGDLTVRAHLRHGDLLRGLATEVNELVEWLNRNPPDGATTGGDVVELEGLPPPPAPVGAVSEVAP